MFTSNFLSKSRAKSLAEQYGTPLFVYSRQRLIEQAQAMLGVSAPFGLGVRYAMKANSHPEILKTFLGQGIQIDASSEYEVEKALAAGFGPERVLLTSQQMPGNLTKLINQGVEYNATSLRQLEVYGQTFPGTGVSVRLNPGLGSGHSPKVNVGGVTSSFGIWHEYIPRILDIAQVHSLSVTRLHTHIGAGADPKVWRTVADISLELIKQFPEATIINLGGGFKVARMDQEQRPDMQQVGRAIAEKLQAFASETGRQLRLELEPGGFLVANAGLLLARVEDIVDTGRSGYRFIKLNTGMNDILRPSLYGSQHPIAVVNDEAERDDYVVVGHNCETGDLLTPASGQPEVLGPRRLNRATVGDIVIIGGTGAYCASMAAHGYNSFPSAHEIVI